MKRKMFLLWILSTPLWGFSQFSLSGRVVDDTSNEPLPGAHVVLEDTYNFTVSSIDGIFNFEHLKPSVYFLKISFMGYDEYRQEINLTGNLSVNVVLNQRAILEDEVVIRATRASVNEPTTYEDLTREALQETNLGKDIPFLLETTPGTVVTSDAGAGIGYTGIRIRGTDITRINVTVNGIPLNDPESQGVFWVNMPDFTSSVDNIQVQRGVGTSTNGAAAFGASINIQTLKLKADPYAEINSSVGSYRTIKNTVLFGTGLINGKFAVDGRLSRISSDGYIDRAKSDLKSFFVSGSYYGENSIVKLNIFSGKEKTYQSWNGVPGDSLETNRTYNPSGEYIGPDGEIMYYDNQTDNYQQDHYQLILSQSINRKLNLNTALFYVRGYGYYESYKQGQKFAEYGLDSLFIGGDTVTQTNLVRRKYLDNDFYGLTFSVNYNSFKKLQATFGGSWNYYDGGHYGTIIWSEYASNGSIDRRWYDNTGTKQQFNVFGKVNYQAFKKVNVFADLQLRGINYEITGTHDDMEDISQKHDFLFFNPRFGAVYNPTSRQKLYFSFAVANREPTRSDYRDSDSTHMPKSEKLFDYELGYGYSTARFKVNANLFYMDYKDQLVLTGEINNVGAPIFTNVAESYRAGIELSGGWKIIEKLRWEGNVSLSQNKVKDFNEYVDDWSPPREQIQKELGETDLSFSPNVIANSILSVEPVEALSFKLVSKYVGEQFIDNTSSDLRKLDPYFVNDIRVNYTFSTSFISEIGLFVNISNIFSVKYETNAWVYRYYYDGVESSMDGYFPQAPINFLAGISLKL